MTIPRRNKVIHVSIPEDVVFMALSREFYSKHQLGPRDAIKTLALEYAYNPKARKLLDRVLKNRLDPIEYTKNIETPSIETDPVEVKYIPPQQKDAQSKLSGEMTPLEKRVNDIWDIE